MRSLPAQPGKVQKSAATQPAVEQIPKPRTSQVDANQNAAQARLRQRRETKITVVAPCKRWGMTVAKGETEVQLIFGDRRINGMSTTPSSLDSSGSGWGEGDVGAVGHRSVRRSSVPQPLTFLPLPRCFQWRTVRPRGDGVLRSGDEDVGGTGERKSLLLHLPLCF